MALAQAERPANAQASMHAQVDAETEYKAIERTLLESPRGRWFLSEHGRRARRLDTLTLHEAVHKLQDSLREPPALLGQLRNEIEGLKDLLSETREALNAKPAPSVPGSQSAVASDGTGQPAGVAATAVGGTSVSNILNVAEAIHELAWDLQSQDINVDACEQIARQASQMYALSHRHAVESERVRKLTDALDGALLRLDGLLETVVMEAQFDTFNPVPDETPAAEVTASEPAAQVSNGAIVEPHHYGEASADTNDHGDASASGDLPHAG
ncbi:MAG: hypothetical protein AAFR70_11105 [Pseudomonadota bacterium]